MIARLLWAELLRAFTNWRYWAVFAGFLVITLATQYMTYSRLISSQTDFRTPYAHVELLVFFGAWGMPSFIVSTMNEGRDISSHMWVRVSRVLPNVWATISSKVVASAVFSFVGCAVGVIVDILATNSLLAQRDISFINNVLDGPASAARMAVLTGVVGMFMAASAVAITVVTRHLLISLGVFLVYVLAIEPIVSILWPTVYGYICSGLMSALIGYDDGVDAEALGSWLALALEFVWLAAFTAVAYLTTTTRKSL